MKIYLAANSTNVSMLYGQFKKMSEEAKRMKVFLAGSNGRRDILAQALSKGMSAGRGGE